MSSNTIPATELAVLTTRIRKSPYFEATLAAGVKGFTVYNHMLMPTHYASPVEDYWHLVKGVTLWDVSVQRQIEVRGPDALRLMQYITPRDIDRCVIGQCQYVLLCDADGGIVNDPVLLRLGVDHFWLSLADSDVGLWLNGLVAGKEWRVDILEPDVSPLAIQGPKSEDLMINLFGDWIRQLRFFYFRETRWHDMPLLIARSGWSKQGGFEIYLRDGHYGTELWDRIMTAGKPFMIAPGAPSTIERVESSLLSYGADMTLANNPLELPVERFYDLDKSSDYMAREALYRIRAGGVRQRLKGLVIDGDPLPTPQDFWAVTHGEKAIGKVTSAAHSLRYRRNLAFAMLCMPEATNLSTVNVKTPAGSRTARVSELPFSLQRTT